MVVTVSAHGQISPFREKTATVGLSKADVDKVFALTKELNESRDAQVGDTRTWNEASSGNSGTVKITKVFQYKAMPCHAMQYDFARTTKRPARRYSNNWCEVSPGEWKIRD